ncbi:signal peptidase I [Paenisporosarcina sp. TG20]|uniref:signal peptidase I n=1 Tax=Paenisporosarcina sp. TG20 TaxID=1211706 RepID=UPI0002DD123B|nr:signal peptidase I [Paenisporosarcina sp. TG20]
MKIFGRIVNTLLAIVILCTLISAVGSAISKEPVLLTVISSNSMYPIWQRGDMVIIDNLNEKEEVHKGDIVFFKTEEGSLSSNGWIAHRVLEGSASQGFITKGDANDYPDQSSDGTNPIERGEISGRAFTIGETPIVIPKLGYLSLWAEEYQKSPYTLPGIALILAVIIGIGELRSGKQRRKKTKGVELQLIYMIGGLTIAIIMGATMLASGQKLNLVYEVTEQNQGVLMGSSVGILKVGDEVSKPLSELNNGGALKLIGAITTDDTQIKLSHNNFPLSSGQQIDTTFTVNAKTPGKYDTSIQVGLFYPFLPSAFIYYLAEKSYWLALVVVSLIPGLPLIIYPMVDGKMRRSTIKFLKRKKRNLQNAIPF